MQNDKRNMVLARDRKVREHVFIYDFIVIILLETHRRRLGTLTFGIYEISIGAVCLND